jgi:RNA polymerase sigma factor (sigma-70 family)
VPGEPVPAAPAAPAGRAPVTLRRERVVRQPGVERLDVARALDTVPREARVLLALHYVDGLGYGELARIRGISVNTVKSQLRRGKAIMKQALEAGGHDGSD